MNQLPLDFNLPVIKSDERGIKKAEKTANKIDPEFLERAYKFLLDFIRNGKQFQCEDVRVEAENAGIISPMSKRVWGSVIRKASREGTIQCVGHAKVTNENAHHCYSSIWIPKIY